MKDNGGGWVNKNFIVEARIKGDKLKVFEVRKKRNERDSCEELEEIGSFVYNSMRCSYCRGLVKNLF
ncbi:hypothetical protein RYX36_004383 [Vicia faba]